MGFLKPKFVPSIFAITIDITSETGIEEGGTEQ